MALTDASASSIVSIARFAPAMVVTSRAATEVGTLVALPVLFVTTRPLFALMLARAVPAGCMATLAPKVLAGPPAVFHETARLVPLPATSNRADAAVLDSWLPFWSTNVTLPAPLACTLIEVIAFAVLDVA